MLTADRSYFRRPETGMAWSVAAVVLSVLMVWFGALALWPARTGTVGVAMGAVQIVLGIAMLWPWSTAVQNGAALATALFWWSTLLFLMTPGAWIQSAPYDGFPYIGAGASLLKHVGLGAIGFGMWARWTRHGVALRIARWTLWAGQLLVLAWLGAMKFTHYDAVGAEAMMRANPLFAWMYNVMDMRAASNLIGGAELAIAALVAVWPWRPRIAAIGLWMAIVSYLLSCTFLFTAVAWQPTSGSAASSDNAQLLIKNLGLLAGALVLVARPVQRIAIAPSER